MKRALLLAGVLAVLGCEAQPMTLLNVNLQVDNLGWSEEFFSLTSDTSVTLRVKVTSGEGVNLRIGSKADPTVFTSALSGNKLREHSASVVLAKGDYLVRVMECSPRKEGAAEKAAVSILVKGKPSWGMRR